MCTIKSVVIIYLFKTAEKRRIKIKSIIISLLGYSCILLFLFGVNRQSLSALYNWNLWRMFSTVHPIIIKRLFSQLLALKPVKHPCLRKRFKTSFFTCTRGCRFNRTSGDWDPVVVFSSPSFYNLNIFKVTVHHLKKWIGVQTITLPIYCPRFSLSGCLVEALCILVWFKVSFIC